MTVLDSSCSDSKVWGEWMEIEIITRVHIIIIFQFGLKLNLFCHFRESVRLKGFKMSVHRNGAHIFQYKLL